MGDTVVGHRAGAKEVVAFIDAAQEHVAEVDRPP